MRKRASVPISRSIIPSFPKEILDVLEKLTRAGFEAHIVGGCVRDMLRGVLPNDWDVATNAKPEEIQNIFPKSFYTNAFGTVTVQFPRAHISEVEVTTYRVDETYTDKRHPDAVTFTRNLKEDLARRDFSINALAMTKKKEVTDLFSGVKDLETKVIRAVGDPDLRFSEDALRMMRAVRFAVTLGFDIEQETESAIKRHSGLLAYISKERIRDEFMKVLEARDARQGVELLEELKLLSHIVPELEEGIGMSQNKHHMYSVWEHNLYSLDWAARAGYNLDVRVASLLHDVGKPRTKEGEGPDSTFYGHQVVGAKMTLRMLERLRFPKKQAERIASLVRNHMFVYNVGEVTERSVRRLVSKVGLENMDDLIDLRIADRKGSGVPKAQPYRLRHFRYMVEKVSRDPISPKMLKAKGDDVMGILKIEPGPIVGKILAILLDEVLDSPEKNKKEYLKGRIKELGTLPEKVLEGHTKAARQKIADIGENIEQESKGRYWVT